jgi:hypothetical protein
MGTPSYEGQHVNMGLDVHREFFVASTPRKRSLYYPRSTKQPAFQSRIRGSTFRPIPPASITCCFPIRDHRPLSIPLVARGGKRARLNRTRYRSHTTRQDAKGT